MELGPQNPSGDGLLGPNSIMVVYMDPLGKQSFWLRAWGFGELKLPKPKQKGPKLNICVSLQVTPAPKKAFLLRAPYDMVIWFPLIKAFKR